MPRPAIPIATSVATGSFLATSNAMMGMIAMETAVQQAVSR